LCRDFWKTLAPAFQPENAGEEKLRYIQNINEETQNKKMRKLKIKTIDK